MSNILDLNEKLFQVFDKLEKGELDPKQAQSLVNVSNAISSNAKLMLQAAKISKNPNISNLMLGEEMAKKIEPKDTYTQKLEFSQENGFHDIAAAITKLGKKEFEQQFKDEYEN
jgi:hypothetical protein